jgi:hypothetical protein
LTGILRVAKESIFSGLNNIAVYSILRPELAPYFGFTEDEVAGLCRLAGMEQFLPELRSWYDGYLFGGHVIYNPWSVLSFLDSEDKVLRPYWMSTSSNDIVREILVGSPEGALEELETLLIGGIIDKQLEEDVALRDVTARSEALWSFLLFSGYLKATEVYYDGTVFRVKLATPNREVSTELAGMVRSWMAAAAGGSADVQRLLGALLGGDARTVERALSRMVKVNLSYFDTGGPEPERVYHAFVVGLLASLGPGYDVRSNRESGFGRCDVLVLPKAPGKPGVVLELKTVDIEEGETPEAALISALAQIRDRDYAAELRERGAAPIHEIAAAFDGKRAYVKLR